MGTILRRSLAASIIKDLQRKIVLVSGPRQVGKTTLAKALIPSATPEIPLKIDS